MPQRASAQQHGLLLGKTLFRGASTQRIASKIQGVGKEKLASALQKRGLNKVGAKDLADVFTGKRREGMSHSDLKKAVLALQDVGAVTQNESASMLVMRSGRTAQGKEGGVTLKDTLSEGQFKRHMQSLSRDRRAEADAEALGSAGESMGVKDRMRTALGRANQAIQDVGAGSASDGRGIRQIRDMLRKDLTIQPKIKLPPPPEEASSTGTGMFAP